MCAVGVAWHVAALVAMPRTCRNCAAHAAARQAVTQGLDWGACSAAGGTRTACVSREAPRPGGLSVCNDSAVAAVALCTSTRCAALRLNPFLMTAGIQRRACRWRDCTVVLPSCFYSEVVDFAEFPRVATVESHTPWGQVRFDRFSHGAHMVRQPPRGRLPGGRGLQGDTISAVLDVSLCGPRLHGQDARHSKPFDICSRLFSSARAPWCPEPDCNATEIIMRDVGPAHGDLDAASAALTRSPVALLVIAHPDDEAMFFAPLLLATRDQWRWRILCLSTGAQHAPAG